MKSKIVFSALVFVSFLLFTVPLVQASLIEDVWQNTLVFFGIIKITNANHLNSDRIILSDIYEEVRELDNIWSEEIPEGDYVRVRFEQNLTSSNDITIYPSIVSGNPKIEIYEKGGTKIIAGFQSLSENKYNKVLLKNLQGNQDTFDLKVLGGSVKFEHIIDPAGNYNISFVAPTPKNNTLQTSTSVIINVSIGNAPDLSEVKYDWDGTNFTIYDTSLVLMMNFENLSSLGENATNVADISNYGNNGTVYGDAFVNVTGGQYGGGLQLDVSGDYIATSDLDVDYITITAWVKAAKSDTFGYIVNKNYAGTVPYSLNVGGNSAPDSIDGIAFYSGGWKNSGIKTDIRGDGKWHFVAGTYDGTTLSYYIDGILDNSSTEGSGVLPKNDNAVDLGRYGNDFQYFEGSIDEVRIFNRSLSASEIQQLYMSNLQKFNSTQWYLYINQNKNSTTGLDYGTYTYQTFAADTSNNLNSTELRTVSLQSSILSNCGSLTIANTVYTMNQSVNTTDTCFNVMANNITIDCAGFVINYSSNGGNDEYGINLSGYNFTTIKNCNITEGNVLLGDSDYAIYYYKSSNGTIENNTIKTGGRGGYGVYLNTNSNSNSILNNTITTSGENGMGIYSTYSNLNILTNNIITSKGRLGRGIFLQIATSNTISSNIIITTGANGYGIWVDRSPNSPISNNNITTSGTLGYGIYLYTNSNSNTLSNNTIITNGSSGYGFNLQTSSNLTISNNNIITSGINGSGIWLDRIPNSTISNNNIITSGINGSGIYLNSSSNNNKLNNNTITTSGIESYGFYLDSSSNNNTFSGMNIKTDGTTAYAISLKGGSHNFTISDSILNASMSGVQELYVVGNIAGGVWNFTNVTRADGNPITINWGEGANGSLNMNWYLKVNVTRANTNALVSDANVTAYNSSGAVMFSTLTGADGLTSNYPLWSFTMTNSSAGTNTTIYSELYTINVTKAEFTNFTNSTVNMTSNLLFNAKLLGGPSSCTCAGSGNNWEISMADNCLINDNCDLNLGNITFTGAGAVTLNSTIHCKNLGAPAAGQILTIGSNALITVG